MYRCVLCEMKFQELPDDAFKVDIVNYHRRSLLYVIDGRAHELLPEGDDLKELPEESPYKEIPRTKIVQPAASQLPAVATDSKLDEIEPEESDNPDNDDYEEAGDAV